MFITLEINKDDISWKTTFPTRWEVCTHCNGAGKHVHPSVSVWTESDRMEDPDGFDAMMDGAYDVPCSECKGRTTVAVIDEEHLSDDQREDLELHRKAERELAESDRIWAQERAMGA